MEEVNDGMGPGGFCICPQCGYKRFHEPGIPCREQQCPQCGIQMVREGSYHHTLSKKKGGNEK